MAQIRTTTIQLALALCFCCLIGCAKQSANLEYVPTGDALYDRFAVLVLDQLDAKWPDGILDFGEVFAWESEFEDNSDYWQLRAFADLEENCDDMFNVFMEGKKPYVDEMLIEKIAGGMDDPGCFAGLLWPSDAAHNLSLTLQLVDQAIASSPDSSYFYYIKAALVYETGDHQEIMAAIEAGNLAAVNERVYSFPYRVALKDPLVNEAAGNQAVAAYLANSHFQRTLVEQVHQKRMFMAILKQTDLTPHEMDQLVIAASRLGSRQNTTQIGLLASLGILKDIEQAVPNQNYGLAPEQLAELAGLFAIIAAVEIEISNHSEQMAGNVPVGAGSNEPPKLPGQRMAQAWWGKVYAEQVFIATLQCQLDPFADPPLNGWKEN